MPQVNSIDGDDHALWSCPDVLPPPVTSPDPTSAHNRTLFSSTFSTSRECLCIYVCKVTQIVTVLLAYLYKCLVLLSLPLIYRGYLGNHLQCHNPGGSLQVDPKAWDRVVVAGTNTCYIAVVCIVSCLRICTPASPTSNITDAKAIVFRYCVAAISIGNLLITIIISVFLRLIKAHRGRVYLLLGDANDNERAWRVQEISILFSVPPSSLIWSIILIMAGMIFFPSDGEVYPGHYPAHSHHDGRHGIESRSVAPFPSDSPAHVGVQQPLLSPVTLLMIVIVAALTLLHFVFILRIVVRLANVEPDTADSPKPSKMMQAGVDALAQANSSSCDCSASAGSECGPECSIGNSSESDSAASIELSARITRRRHRRPSAAHPLHTQDSMGI